MSPLTTDRAVYEEIFLSRMLRSPIAVSEQPMLGLTEEVSRLTASTCIVLLKYRDTAAVKARFVSQRSITSQQC